MWTGLVSEEMPVNMEEIARLNQILKMYETENLRLVRDNEVKDSIIDANQMKQAQMEKERQGNVKKLKTLEGTLKFERIAAEGLTKKAGVLEIECTLLKEDKLAIEDKLVRFQRRVEQLESTFNKDRSKLLQNIHEIELLSIQNANCERRASEAEERLRTSQTEMLTKLQIAETLIAKTERQQRTVHEQADEMLALTREVYELRMRKNELTEIVAEQEKKISVYETRTESLNAEIHRLRRELLDIAQTHSQKSLAFFTGLSEHRVQARTLESNLGDRRVQYTSVKDLSASLTSGLQLGSLPQLQETNYRSVSPSRQLDSASRPFRQPARPSSVISALSTAHRPHLDPFSPKESLMSPLNASLPSGLGNTSLKSNLTNSAKVSGLSLRQSTSTDFMETGTGDRSDSAHPHSTGQRSNQDFSLTVQVSKKVHSELASMTSKSMFVGSGLGLRQERSPAISSNKGTAKQALKAIMAKFDS